MEIRTDRLRIVNCDLPLIQAVLQGNEALAVVLGVEVPADWTEFGAPIFQYTLERLAEYPEDAKWWSWLPLIAAENRLVGSCGYKGRPNADGEVEIGYEIAASRRELGLATEAARALVQHAFAHAEVQKVTAHTLAEENASTKVLRRCGLAQVGELMDPEDGLLWRWELTRGDFETQPAARK